MVLPSSHPKKLAYFDLPYRPHAPGKKISSRMLKKHALSIAEGSASFVLAALGGSDVPNRVRLASSLAAAAPDEFLTILRAALILSLIS